MKRKQKSKKSNVYFTKDTERAIVAYNSTHDFALKNKIFNESLKYPLEKLAENIINTFKFSYFDDHFQNIKLEVVSFMIEKMHQYDAAKGKAFSYFSIVAKNYLILTNNTNYKRLKMRDGIDILDLNRNFHGEFKSAETNTETKEFIGMMVDFWEKHLPDIFRKDRDRAIANAVIELFRKLDSIENFNKKALYILIREMTDCKTQQITKIINQMKKYYFDISKKYHTTGEINMESSNPFF